MEIWPGDPYPLGASFDGTGTNFSIFSEVAWRVELCLFGEDGAETRLDMPEQTALCWHGYVPNVRPGQRYGFRVHGPYDPRRGIRCNRAKLLLDPYARAIEGDVRRNRATFPPDLRGTYAALATPDAIEYFKSLGVTAIEVLPVHQFVHDHGLVERGMRNYWGYNSIGY